MYTILVVDDEPTIRVLIRSTLEGKGYRLLEAADGMSALQVAQRERPDLILLDIALPSLNGIEVCRRLKKDPATASAQIFFLTGLLPPTKHETVEDIGAQGCIAKPFSPAALEAQIEDALSQGTVVGSR